MPAIIIVFCSISPERLKQCSYYKPILISKINFAYRTTIISVQDVRNVHCKTFVHSLLVPFIFPAVCLSEIKKKRLKTSKIPYPSRRVLGIIISRNAFAAPRVFRSYRVFYKTRTVFSNAKADP